MPKFTIGIPTYNRSGFLKRSLWAALEQSYTDLEIIVSDNASTDDTPEVVRSFGGRVRYHRNSENIGAERNFARLTELAEGDYFSWLQDDDVIHCDFARRAVETFESDPKIVMYTAFFIITHSYNTLIMPLICGPPVAVDWTHSKLRVLDGLLVTPISFFVSFSMPPVAAYRTEEVRRAVRDIDPASILFNERVIQSRAVADGKVAVDPWTAGTFYQHAMQGSRLYGSCDIPERSRQWLIMAEELRRMLEERPEKAWRPLLDAWLEELSPHDSDTILNELPPIPYWSQFHPLTYEICTQLLDRVSESRRRDFLAPLTEASRLNGDNHNTPVKDLGRRLTPPLLWDALKEMKKKMTRPSH